MKKKTRIFDYSSETFDAYQASLDKDTHLSADEERALGIRIRQGDTRARNKLVEANLFFVIKCAKEFCDYQVPLEELISAGNSALVAAADRYDPTYENRFISYAVHNIRQSMRNAVNEYRHLVHIPTDKLKMMNFHYETLDTFGNSNRDDDDDYRPCLQNKLSAEPTTSQTEMLLDEESEELRLLLLQYFLPNEVELIMDYAQMCANGYDLKCLAEKYHMPLRYVVRRIKALRHKIDALNLHAAYLNQAA